jgi:hypothetical protein
VEQEAAMAKKEQKKAAEAAKAAMDVREDARKNADREAAIKAADEAALRAAIEELERCKEKEMKAEAHLQDSCAKALAQAKQALAVAEAHHEARRVFANDRESEACLAEKAVREEDSKLAAEKAARLKAQEEVRLLKEKEEALPVGRREQLHRGLACQLRGPRQEQREDVRSARQELTPHKLCVEQRLLRRASLHLGRTLQCADGHRCGRQELCEPRDGLATRRCMAHRKQLARELGQRQSAAAAAAAAAELPHGGTGRAMAVETAAAELCCTGRAMGSQEQGAHGSHSSSGPLVRSHCLSRFRRIVR